MKTKTSPLLITAFAGFLAGCAVMCFILPGRTSPIKVSAPGSLVAARQTQTQAEKVQKSPTTGAAQTTAQRGAEKRRALSEIRRNKVASVDVPFFTSSGFQASDASISQQFIDFFELTPAQAGELSDLVKKAKEEMWSAAKAQAQVSQTETGGIVIKIPPLASGPDIYDRLMSGFQTVLGDDRYNDMMLYNYETDMGNQFERSFNEFGAEERTVTIERNDDGRYKVTDSRKKSRESSAVSYTATLDELKQRNPELLEFIPAQ